MLKVMPGSVKSFSFRHPVLNPENNFLLTGFIAVDELIMEFKKNKELTRTSYFNFRLHQKV